MYNCIVRQYLLPFLRYFSILYLHIQIIQNNEFHLDIFKHKHNMFWSYSSSICPSFLCSHPPYSYTTIFFLFLFTSHPAYYLPSRSPPPTVLLLSPPLHFSSELVGAHGYPPTLVHRVSTRLGASSHSGQTRQPR